MHDVTDLTQNEVIGALPATTSAVAAPIASFGLEWVASRDLPLALFVSFTQPIYIVPPRFPFFFFKCKFLDHSAENHRQPKQLLTLNGVHYKSAR